MLSIIYGFLPGFYGYNSICLSLEFFSWKGHSNVTLLLGVMSRTISSGTLKLIISRRKPLRQFGGSEEWNNLVLMTQLWHYSGKTRKSPLGGKLPSLVGGNNSEAITLSLKSPKESSGNNNRKGIQKRLRWPKAWNATRKKKTSCQKICYKNGEKIKTQRNIWRTAQPSHHSKRCQSLAWTSLIHQTAPKVTSPITN